MIVIFLHRQIFSCFPKKKVYLPCWCIVSQIEKKQSGRRSKVQNFVVKNVKCKITHNIYRKFDHEIWENKSLIFWRVLKCWNSWLQLLNVSKMFWTASLKFEFLFYTPYISFLSAPIPPIEVLHLKEIFQVRVVFRLEICQTNLHGQIFGPQNSHFQNA